MPTAGQRQEQRISLEGLVGLVEAEGEALAELSPLLGLLPLVNVGKKTTHGFGHLLAVPGAGWAAIGDDAPPLHLSSRVLSA